MDKFMRVGKVDRAKQKIKRGLSCISLEPNTPTQRAIIDLHNKIHSMDTIDENNAVSVYLNARNHRHDIWLDFLQMNRAQEGFVFCEQRFGTYMNQVIENLNLQSEDIYPPDHLKNKSPDILIYDYIRKSFFVGDVAVSVARRTIEQRKYTKYLPIVNYLSDKGFRVIHINFVIDNDLTTANDLVKSFVNVGLITLSEDSIIKTSEYHKSCNRIMIDASEKCSNKILFQKILLTEDRKIVEHVDDIADEQLIDLEPDVPIRTEDEIIKMIGLMTDKNLNTYFDDGYSAAEQEFIGLYAEFNKRPHHKPKSTLKVIHNSKDIEQYTSHSLLREYLLDIPFSNDDDVSNYLINLLPTLTQVEVMKNYIPRKVKDKELDKIDKLNGVFGKWQFKQSIKYYDNHATSNYHNNLTKGKKNPNVKTEPSTVSPDMYPFCIDSVNQMIHEFGSQSDKSSFLDDSWDCKSTKEFENTVKEKEIYNMVRQSNGAQLGQSLSMFYQRLTHLQTILSTKDNIFIPPNGSFIAIIPSKHQPFTSNQSDVPIIFVTRVKSKSKTPIHEYEYTFSTEHYHYYISKLCRLPLDKIAHWDQAGHKIVACSSYLLSNCTVLETSMKETIGLITMLSLDLHQKTSELLDLLKYVSFMPFSDISRVSRLIRDKFDIMLKTSLDVWIIKKIEDFMHRLSLKGNVVGAKSKLKVFNGGVLQSSLGMAIEIPSFITNLSKHKKIQHFIEEISMINIVRGKQFYGSQFMEKSLCLTAQWNNEFFEESIEYKGWVNGHDSTSFPFDAKFCYSKDAIIYALNHFNSMHILNKNTLAKKLSNLDYSTFIHKVCTLRGCTKEIPQRSNHIDLHTTSLDAALNYYKTINYDDEKANTVNFAKKFLEPGYIAQYSMSEKKQRGGGRPIATPTLITKIGNLMIEKPEQAIGTFTSNNILVAGKHKLKTQSDTYKRLLERGYAKGKKCVFQCTEDQSKFSENDNTRKYYTYIRNNTILSDNVRQLQYKCIEKMIGREHLTKKLPIFIIKNDNLLKYINAHSNGVKSYIGWPQGMLNNISTSIHSIADYWITHAFNKYYKTDIIVEGLVHSDDSWFAIACNSLDEFKKFAIFRAYAKRMFCLKLNDKKLWGSRLLGELVSNFNINGEVLVPVGKTIANGFGNLLYQNWVIDTHTQISTLQQVYRQGANLATMVMLSTILRQQIISAYNLTNKLPSFFYCLPIEMGGYPNCSVFELGVTGVNSHYKHIYDIVIRDPLGDLSKIILRTMWLSMQFNKQKEDIAVSAEVQKYCKTKFRDLYDDKALDIDSYNAVIVPRRGEVFSCIKHIMPKSKKISLTMNKIKELPFETDNLEMLVTNPKSLAVALGHLKSQMNTLLFSLASEKYTGSKRRLAINQSIQATGKTVQLAGFKPMTMLELITHIHNIKEVPCAMKEQLEVSFQDETNLVDLTNTIVHFSETCVSNDDKRRKVNRMPEFENKYRTICTLRNVLLNIIDMYKGTEHVKTFTSNADPIEILLRDSELITTRFNTYFEYYSVEYACNLIMQQYYSRIQARLWTQPSLRVDDMQNFLEDLYGKTLNVDINYSVTIDIKNHLSTYGENAVISSIYTVAVLNKIYDSKFKVIRLQDIELTKILKSIDISRLTASNCLKHAILMYIVFDNKIYLDKYDDTKRHRHYYIVEQKLIKGAYRGRFEVVIEYGKLVMKIVGEPGDLKLIVNDSTLTREITMAMLLYINKDHPDFSYNYHGSWNTNKFWKTISYKCDYSLMTYGNNVTLVKKRNVDDHGVGMDVLHGLKYNIREPNEIADKYTFDDTLRVVYKHVGNNRIRLDNVKQNMSCPLSSYFILEQDFIDGFSNNDLLHGKVILNITMRRSFSASTKDVMLLLQSRAIPPNQACVARCLFRICQIFAHDRKYGIMDDLISDPAIEYKIEGETAASFIDIHKDEEPSSLAADEINCLFEESNVKGSLFKHRSLLTMFTKYVVPALLEVELQEFVELILNDSVFKVIIPKIIRDFNEDPELIHEYIGAFEGERLDLLVFCFIISNNLDMASTFNKMDFKRMISANREFSDNHKINRWFNLFKAEIKVMFVDYLDVQPPSLLNLLG